MIKEVMNDKEKVLSLDELEEVSGGKGISETLDYALEQGKKVAAVVSDKIEDLFQKK